jgi:hypothetical protein
MISRKIRLSIPLSQGTTYDLLLQAGEKLPASSDVAGIKFGYWENTLADRESGQLEWRMYDSDYATITISVSLNEDKSGGTQGDFIVKRVGQVLDPLGLYKETLRLLTDPFLELVKQRVGQNQAQ